MSVCSLEAPVRPQVLAGCWWLPVCGRGRLGRGVGPPSPSLERASIVPADCCRLPARDPPQPPRACPPCWRARGPSPPAGSDRPLEQRQSLWGSLRDPAVTTAGCGDTVAPALGKLQAGEGARRDYRHTGGPALATLSGQCEGARGAGGLPRWWPWAQHAPCVQPGRPLCSDCAAVATGTVVGGGLGPPPLFSSCLDDSRRREGPAGLAGCSVHPCTFLCPPSAGTPAGLGGRDGTSVEEPPGVFPGNCPGIAPPPPGAGCHPAGRLRRGPRKAPGAAVSTCWTETAARGSGSGAAG